MKPFTPREMEIIRLLGTGASVKAIAARLDITVGGVRFHVKSAAGKIPDHGPALRKVTCYGFWLIRTERDTTAEEAA